MPYYQNYRTLLIIGGIFLSAAFVIYKIYKRRLNARNIDDADAAFTFTLNEILISINNLIKLLKADDNIMLNVDNYMLAFAFCLCELKKHHYDITQQKYLLNSWRENLRTILLHSHPDKNKSSKHFQAFYEKYRSHKNLLKTIQTQDSKWLYSSYHSKEEIALILEIAKEKIEIIDIKEEISLKSGILSSSAHTR